MRLELTLQCGECKRGNYRTSRNRDLKEKISISKFCPHCRRHTVHKENRR